MTIYEKNQVTEKLSLDSVQSKSYHSKMPLRNFYYGLKKICLIGLAVFCVSNISAFAIDKENTSDKKNVSKVEIIEENVFDPCKHAIDLLNDKHYQEGLECLKKLVDSGNISAQIRYAEALSDGLYGMAANGEQAIEYFNNIINNPIAVAYEIEYAKYKLATLYFEGKSGVQQDADKALALWVEVASNPHTEVKVLAHKHKPPLKQLPIDEMQEDSEYFFEVGEAYYNAIGVQQNKEEGIAMLLLAGTVGNVFAWCALGEIAFYGYENPQLAKDYYLIAANGGCHEAMQYVSILYKLEGNDIEAQFWLEKALSHLPEKADSDNKNTMSVLRIVNNSNEFYS